MKNKILLLICIFFIIPSILALAFPQNSDADIKHAVRFDGGNPPASTNCNISVYYSNGTILINYQPMTNQGNYFNYTLNNSQTSTIGKYLYEVTCLANSGNKTISNYFYVNPGGVDPSQNITDSLTRTIYIMFGLGVLFFIAFLLIRENITFKYTFFLLSILMFLITVNFIFISLQDEVVSPRVQGFFEGFTVISFYMFWGIGFLIFSIWIVAIINTVLQGKKNTKDLIYGEEL